MTVRFLPFMLAGLLCVACSEKRGGEAPKDTETSHTLVNDTVTGRSAVVADSMLVREDPSDEPACYPGGTDALRTAIRKRLRYPETARSMHLEGRVIVEAGVDSRGRVGKCAIFMSDSPVLDAEALRVVKTLPPFTPCKKDGKAVAGTVKIPVFFRLDK